ncbi:MAG TPA: hypothetical protein VM577_04845 [Anaerovoracaceae bacterium]|nr:hypothetical protein [Anaerovoracaceae bacterium]
MDANILFNNSSNEFTSAFQEEDEVQVLIAGVPMYDGFVYDVYDTLYPSRRKDLGISIMDWGSYFASKTIFERDYQLTKHSKDLLLDGAAKIIGLSIAGVDSIGLQGANFAVKGRRFLGTYVKDVWYAAAETGGFDYYIDENKVLQAWKFEDVVDSSGNVRAIRTGGHNYQIVDFLPTQPYQLMIRIDKQQQKWSRNALNKYRSVTVENGLIQNYPADINSGVTDSVHPKGYAYELSLWWLGQLDSIYDAGSGTIPVQKPYDFISGEDVGNGFSIPTIHSYVGNNSSAFRPVFIPRQYSLDQTKLINGNMKQPYTTWQKIGFFINVKNLNPIPTSIKLRLVDLTTVPGADFFREIITDFTPSNGWVYLEYNLPTTNSPANNGWSTEFGAPQTIDEIVFDMTPSSGYTVGTHIDFANFNLWGVLGATPPPGAGSPATQQIIINKNLTDPTQLLAYATRAQLRANQTAVKPQVTIDGFDMNGNFKLTDFKRPGYKIDIDLSASLGSGRVANSLRIDEIKLFIDAGVTYATITFDNSFNRP